MIKEPIEMMSGSITFFSIWKNNLFSIGESFLFLLIAIWKSFWWFILTLFFGLLQIWFIAGEDFFRTTNLYPFEKFVTDGALLFFCVTVISSLTMDYIIFSRGIFSWKKNGYTIFAFVIFPGAILGICIYMFGLCYPIPTKELDIDAIFKAEMTIFMITFIYAIVIKSLAFYKDQRCAKCST
jgi:hypothetical protein